MGRRWGIASYVVSSSYFVGFDCGWITPIKKLVFCNVFVFGLLLVTTQALLDLTLRKSVFTTKN